jgi:hypothetical protein
MGLVDCRVVGLAGALTALIGGFLIICGIVKQISRP